ncbi:MAG: hypothetical protein AABY32_02055 [Nanoarchaeota archaeon]
MKVILSIGSDEDDRKIWYVGWRGEDSEVEFALDKLNKQTDCSDYFVVVEEVNGNLGNVGEIY